MPLMNQFSSINYLVGQRHKGKDIVFLSFGTCFVQPVVDMLSNSFDIWAIKYNTFGTDLNWPGKSLEKPGDSFGSTTFSKFKSIFTIWYLWCIISFSCFYDSDIAIKMLQICHCILSIRVILAFSQSSESCFLSNSYIWIHVQISDYWKWYGGWSVSVSLHTDFFVSQVPWEERAWRSALSCYMSFFKRFLWIRRWGTWSESISLLWLIWWEFPGILFRQCLNLFCLFKMTVVLLFFFFPWSFLSQII